MKRTIVIGAAGAASAEMSRARLGTPPGGRAYTCPNLRLGRIKAVAQAVLLLATVLGFTHLCFADGKVFPPVAFPANVTIPDQRALIHFTNGTERLVIETRFSGTGTNFAWVVPLPAQPVIEEATTGLFPTLQYLFRPQIRHDVPRYYIGILVVTGLLCLLRLATHSVRETLVCAFLILVTAAMLLPTLGKARSKGSMGATAPAGDQAVSILDRRLVGVFETTTISSREPTALQAWLRDNGFAVSTNSEPVIASYVKDGWVFVAAKIRRDKPATETSTPHPLSFTFKTDKPVYPMRLTGVDNGPLSVELYVFGRWRAEAEHFRLECCAHPDFPSPTEPRATALHWPRRSPGTPSIVHPLLRQWVEGAPVVTKLFATLTPAQMEKDVWLRWSRFREKRNQIYSESGALTLAMNWGSGLFTSGLVAAFAAFLARPALRPKLGLTIGFVTMASLALTGLIYIALPTTEIRLVKHPHSTAQEAMIYLSMWLLDTKETTRAEASAEIAREIAQPNDQNPRVRREQRYGGKGWDNLILGGSIREEDSPGNCTLRVNGDELEFVAYDAQGGEHVLGSWRLRREP